MRSFGAKAICAMLMLGGTAHAAPEVKKTYAKCSVPIVLKGTIVAEGRPEWSQAQIDDSETKSSRTFTLKKPWIRTGVKMVEIGEGFITVEVGKAKTVQRCYTEKHKFTAPEQAVATQKVALKAPALKDDGSPKAVLRDAIEQLADFPGMTANSKEAKYGFWNKDLRTNAVHINSLRKKSPLWGMGLRPYDVLFSINGVEISDPSKAREIYKNMAGDTTKLMFEVKRRGKRIKIEHAP